MRSLLSLSPVVLFALFISLLTGWQFAQAQYQYSSTVDKAYQTILDRSPDSGGAQFWSDQIRDNYASGGTVDEAAFFNQFLRGSENELIGQYTQLQQVSASDVTSAVTMPSYINYSDPIDRAVTDMYLILLDRLPEQTGFDFWRGRYVADYGSYSQANNEDFFRSVYMDGEIELLEQYQDTGTISLGTIGGLNGFGAVAPADLDFSTNYGDHYAFPPDFIGRDATYLDDGRGNNIWLQCSDSSFRFNSYSVVCDSTRGYEVPTYDIPGNYTAEVYTLRAQAGCADHSDPSCRITLATSSVIITNEQTAPDDNGADDVPSGITNFFGRVADGLRNLFTNTVQIFFPNFGDDAVTQRDTFANLPSFDSSDYSGGTRTLDDIEAIVINTNVPDPDNQCNGIAYEAFLITSAPPEVGLVGCINDSSRVSHLEDIANKLNQNHSFEQLALVNNDGVSGLSFKPIFFGDASAALDEGVLGDDDPTADPPPPVDLEVKVLNASGGTVTNWTTNDVSITDDQEIAFRWDASADYDQCLPFLADNGNYALSRGSDTAMITGDTEAEGYDINEETGLYFIECSQSGQTTVSYGSITVNVTSSNTAPVGTLSVSTSQTVSLGAELTFTNFDSSCPSIYEGEVEWGDGSVDSQPIVKTGTCDTIELAHTYDGPGVYTIRVRHPQNGLVATENIAITAAGTGNDLTFSITDIDSVTFEWIGPELDEPDDSDSQSSNQPKTQEELRQERLARFGSYTAYSLWRKIPAMAAGLIQPKSEDYFARHGLLEYWYNERSHWGGVTIPEDVRLSARERDNEARARMGVSTGAGSPQSGNTQTSTGTDSADEGFTVYTINLKNGITHKVNIPAFATEGFVEQQFRDVGYVGDVQDLIDMAVGIGVSYGDLSVTPEFGVAPLTVTFDVIYKDDAVLTFGDGSNGEVFICTNTTNCNQSATVTHTYDDPGTYTAWLVTGCTSQNANQCTSGVSQKLILITVDAPLTEPGPSSFGIDDIVLVEHFQGQASTGLRVHQITLSTGEVKEIQVAGTSSSNPITPSQQLSDALLAVGYTDTVEEYVYFVLGDPSDNGGGSDGGGNNGDGVINQIIGLLQLLFDQTSVPDNVVNAITNWLGITSDDDNSDDDDNTDNNDNSPAVYSTAEFVTAVFNEVLDRDPTADERARYVGDYYLANNREEFLNSFLVDYKNELWDVFKALDSNDFGVPYTNSGQDRINRTVHGAYLSILSRDYDQSGFDFWVDVYQDLYAEQNENN